MKRKVFLFLSVLLLSMSLSGCGISSSAELPTDPPAGTETAEEKLFTPTVTVADVDLHEIDLDLLWNRDTAGCQTSATLSWKTSKGVFQPRHFLGRWLRRSSTR